MSVRVQEQSTRDTPLQRGVRQGVIISAKLLTTALEDPFKFLEWKVSDINCNYLIHLCFCRRYYGHDRIAARSKSMLDDLYRVCQQIQINMDKSPMLRPIRYQQGALFSKLLKTYTNSFIVLVTGYPAGQVQFRESGLRIQLGWAAFGKYATSSHSTYLSVSRRKSMFVTSDDVQSRTKNRFIRSSRSLSAPWKGLK